MHNNHYPRHNLPLWKWALSLPLSLFPSFSLSISLWTNTLRTSKNFGEDSQPVPIKTVQLRLNWTLTSTFCATFYCSNIQYVRNTVTYICISLLVFVLQELCFSVKEILPWEFLNYCTWQREVLRKELKIVISQGCVLHCMLMQSKKKA